MSIKAIAKKTLSYQKRLKLKYRFRHYKACFYLNNLNEIAKIHKTDKAGGHHYAQHYQHHFNSYRFKRINLLEIGVGGYTDPYLGANSLRMWKTFFPLAKIYALDIYDKSFLQERRIKIYKGSQDDKQLLEKIAQEASGFDLIIDDGSHINEHVIATFQYLFPKLRIGGIYVIEDTQTSYWEDYGGSSENLNKQGTIYHYFKSLIDSLNNVEFVIDNYEKTYYDKHIVSMHFYHNMIFIYKGINDKKSNFVVNNKRRNG
ncbi:class I SAM-dependent methyltransferase [Gelidibacter salicanalis]|uniref:Class I SAM-dependent methyltransferase n=1 Tax=Gelidibacter salicanalis TaxID=291193 RepID=A0A934NH96_9FLAO|nr:class I SAM-dependent methyltransferase [Gelidibacter salicanalis]MBJ7880576.1 class I SAM-dependent methyltransferase [Gelidibacter salicanalis]